MYVCLCENFKTQNKKPQNYIYKTNIEYFFFSYVHNKCVCVCKQFMIIFYNKNKEGREKYLATQQLLSNESFLEYM